jgi:hypothetical protein
VEEVASEKMGLYAAGLSFGTSFFTPVIEAAIRCLQDAGIDKAGALRIVEGVFQQSLRSYVHAGKRSWTAPASADWELDALSAADPILAEQYRQARILARNLLGGSGVERA